MSYTASFTDADGRYFKRSDRPNEAFPANDRCREYRQAKSDGVQIEMPDFDAVTDDQIKAEAQRRILSIAEEWKQRNMIAQGVEYLNILQSGGTLTVEQERQAAENLSVWAKIKVIRDASNAIEQMSPRPKDFRTNEKLWSAD